MRSQSTFSLYICTGSTKRTEREREADSLKSKSADLVLHVFSYVAGDGSLTSGGRLILVPKLVRGRRSVCRYHVKDRIAMHESVLEQRRAEAEDPARRYDSKLAVL